MSVSALSAEADVISRLQLAKALKEDPGNRNSDPPENSAIFNRQRNRQQPTRGPFYIPRPMNLLIPPILGNAEEYYKDNNIVAPSSQPNVLSSQQQQQQPVFQQDRRPSQPQIYTSSPRNSTIISEERRGSASKPATLLDVRQSMLQVRQNMQNSIQFSASSSQKTSIILQQNKSLPVDTNGKLHGSSRLSTVTSSRPNSVVSSSRPISSYTNNTNARSVSSHKSNKSLNSDENEDEESKSQKSKEIKKNESSSPDDLDSKPPLLPPIKSVNQSISLEKVEEEDSSSSSSEDEDDDDDDDSEDDTPLALKSTPKIKVAPPRITTRKGSSGGRIEAWLEHVSGSPEGPHSRSSTPTHSPRPSTPTHSPRPSTPTHSPRSSTPTHSPRSSTPNHSPTFPHTPRVRKTSEHSVYQYNSSPLSPHRMSHAAEPTYDARNRRPKSAYFSDNLQAPTPDFHQPRKRSNSEFVPKIRPNSVMYYDQVPLVPPLPGRVSPSPRQDSGYWAKDTLISLSDDLRHISLMNDSSSSHSSSSRNRSSSVGNISSNNAKLSPINNNNVSKVMNRHRREGSGSSLHNKSGNLQLHVPPQGSYLSQIPPTQSSRSKDSLLAPSTMNGNRNSFYMNGNGIPQRFSSEQLKANRNSTYSLHQQKHRIKS